MAKLGLIVRQLEQLVPLLGVGTEAGQAVVKALTNLSKHVQPGAVSPGAEQSGLQQLMMKLKQNGPMLAQMQNKQGGGGSAPPPTPETPPAAAAA